MTDPLNRDESTNASPQVTDELVGDLRRWFRSRVPNEHDADDLVQETLLRVYGKADELDQVERLDHWVRRVASNLLVDHRRKVGGIDEPTDGVVEPRIGESDESQDAVVAGWLRSMVDTLPDTYRDVMQLAELDGLTQREVAERLGLSVSGVKSRVQRGRAQVRAKLVSCCELEFDRRGAVIDYQRRAREDRCC